MRKKQNATIDRETALKQLAAFGGIGCLLPFLTVSADAAKKPVTPASSNPMNLSYVVNGSLTSSGHVKMKAAATPTPGTLTVLAWEDPASPQPANGLLIYSFDGDAFTANGKYDEKCLYDGKKQTGTYHVRVYFMAKKSTS